MKKLQSKDNYIFVKKDKTDVYGSIMYVPDTFDETSIIEVSKEEAEIIKHEHNSL